MQDIRSLTSQSARAFNTIYCFSIYPETKSRGIFTNIHETEANNCFSIITQVIIEIPRQRSVTIFPQFAIVNSSYHAARINVSRNAVLNSRSEEKNILFDVHTG